jgi:hypothetical protein
MPTASVKPYLSDDRTGRRFRFDLWLPVAVLAALIAVALLAPGLKPGPFVGRVTLVNHSEYAVDVDVAGASTAEWMPLGTTGVHASTSIASVFDQGSTWTFRFSVQGHELGEIVESRAELARVGWQVVVPDRFIAQLRSSGVPATA